MRRGRRGKWGCVAIGVGLIIILSMLLPAEFWWLVFAASLISLGICYIHG